MQTLKLVYLYITKALSRSVLDKEFQIGCETTEIELKKISPFGFGSPGGSLRYYRKCSRATTLKFFVKSYGGLGRSSLLIRYIILQSITLMLFTSLVLFLFLLGLFEILPKSGKSSLFPPKDRQCLLRPNGEGTCLI